MVVQQVKRTCSESACIMWWSCFFFVGGGLTCSVLTLVVVDVLTQSTDPSCTFIPKSTNRQVNELIWHSDQKCFGTLQLPKLHAAVHLLNCWEVKLLDLWV